MPEHAWITTLRRDGSPRTSRVWFVESAGAIWVATSTSAYKVRDLGRDERVAFAIEGRDGALSSTARAEPIESHPEVVRAFATKYGGWDAADASVYGPRILIRVAMRA
jgi:F420H(2)-dependent biliverdin reductase